MTISINYEWSDTKYAIAEALLPLLLRYRENYLLNGYSLPTWLDENPKEEHSEEENDLKYKWIEKLDCMIAGFQSLLAYRAPDIYKVRYDEELIQEAINLFAKYYQHLWD
jgi:hypothetical protein